MDICNAVLAGLTQTADHNVVLELSDTVRSCLQWDAVLKAGFTQAKAARYAGTMAFWSGVAAFCAAIVIAAAAYLGVRSQIRAEDFRRVDQRTFEVKRETYLQVCDALFAGLMVIPRALDNTQRIGDVFTNYNLKASHIARIHMIADVATVEAVLKCVMSLSGPHSAAIKRHQQLSNLVQPLLEPDRRALADEALNDLVTLSKPFSVAILKMRAELGFQINQQEYEEIIERNLLEAIRIARQNLGIV